MNWIQQAERLYRKHRCEVKRRNVRAYRKRQQEAGIRRLDVALDEQRYAELRGAMLPGETVSAAIGRLLDSVSRSAGTMTNPTPE